jgi:hypothetical protein
MPADLFNAVVRSPPGMEIRIHPRPDVTKNEGRDRDRMD